MEATWENQLIEARGLETADLRRHASVSMDNRHRCKDCFCCAALTILECERHCLVNGIKYEILAETPDPRSNRPLLMIRRPNGVKQYVARRILGTTYGENRAQILAPAPLVGSPAQVPTA